MIFLWRWRSVAVGRYFVSVAVRLLIAFPAAAFLLLCDFCYGDMPGAVGPMECQKLDASWLSGPFALLGALAGAVGTVVPRLTTAALVQALSLTVSVTLALGSVWLGGNVDRLPAALLAFASAVAWVGYSGARWAQPDCAP